MGGYSKTSLKWIILLVSVLATTLGGILVWRFIHHHGDTFGKKPTRPTSPAPPTTPRAVYMGNDGKPFPFDAIRLNPHIVPSHYDIEMTSDLDKFYFNGKVTIELKVNNALNFIVLHVKQLKYSKPTVVDSNGDDIEVIRYVECYAKEQLYIEFNRKLQEELTYKLEMTFNGNITDSLNGFYRSSYRNKDKETIYLALTQFEPTDARSAFPCFDEPNLKATFSMRMTRDKRMTSTLFNTPRISSEESKVNNELMIDTFERTVKMSTYLVAWVVSDFAKITDTTPSGKIVNVYTPQNLIEKAQFALESGVKVLESYEKYFDVPYPLKKQDLVGIPDFSSGAMENWGLITFKMSNIVYDDKVSSAANKEHIAVDIAHEMAHQWFGNLVTMDWWNDLWLNEGFASFLSSYGSNIIDKSWKSKDKFVKRLTSALYEDSLFSSHPISVEVKDPAEISSIFDSISYSKGASILHMLQSFIGENVLRAGLKNYLNKYKYKNTVTDDLWNTLTETMNNIVAKEDRIDVKKVMNTWTNQMGYPVVTVTKDENGNVKATQKRFVLYSGDLEAINDKYPTAYDYKWHIPLTVMSDVSEAEDKNRVHWMHMGDVTFKVSKDSKWIKANVDTNGYYRVQYSEENWKAISATLKEDHTVMSTTDRVGLIDDSFSLARSGLLDISIPLELCEYLVEEKEYLVWSIAFEKLEYIRDQMQLLPEYDDFVEYYLELLKNRLDDQNWEHSNDVLQGYLRTSVLNEAIKLNHKDTVSIANKLFNKFMTSGRRINPDWYNIVYRSGIEYGGEEQWQFLWKQFTESEVATQKFTILSALGKTRDSLLIQRYLDKVLNQKEISIQYTRNVLNSVASTASGRILTWEFFKQHYDLIFERFGDGQFVMASIINGVCGQFTTEYYLNNVQTFFKGRNAGSGQNSVAHCLENISINMDWHLNQKQAIRKWLKNRKSL